jgi:hypothetical protein
MRPPPSRHGPLSRHQPHLQGSKYQLLLPAFRYFPSLSPYSNPPCRRCSNNGVCNGESESERASETESERERERERASERERESARESAATEREQRERERESSELRLREYISSCVQRLIYVCICVYIYFCRYIYIQLIYIHKYIRYPR